ncbi:MAG: hypothetical protein U1E53_02000 [Dongiaceae bacterium]
MAIVSVEQASVVYPGSSGGPVLALDRVSLDIEEAASSSRRPAAPAAARRHCSTSSPASSPRPAAASRSTAGR